MIILTVRFCLVLNPYLCQTLEMVPADGHSITSQMECIKGGALGSASFTKDHMEWQTRGWHCRETPTLIETWLKQRSD